MAAERAPFYARDPDRFALNVVEPKKEIEYTGVERRMENRRNGRDRRVDVRFNLTKSDRREGRGRRAEDALPEFW
jgi:hypothetical protein